MPLSCWRAFRRGGGARVRFRQAGVVTRANSRSVQLTDSEYADYGEVLAGFQDRRCRNDRYLQTVGDRAFCVAAAETWNSLPSEVTSSLTLSTFKQKLKTYVFSLSFPGT